MYVPEELSSFLFNFPGKQIFCLIKNGDVRHICDDITNCYDSLKRYNDEGYEVYFTVNESKTNRRLKADIKKARAVFVDMDTPSATGPIAIHKLKPSIIVESSPGKYHYYWLTSTKDLKTWTDTQKSLIQLYKSDPAIHDPSRVLRLPTFRHRNGSICKVVEINTNYYEWEQIQDNYPPSQLIENVGSTKDNPTSDFNLAKAIMDFATAESISPSMNSLIMHWTHRYREPLIRQNIEQLFEIIHPDVFAANTARYKDAYSQIDKFIKSAKAKVGERVDIDIDTFKWPDPTPLPLVDSMYAETEFPSHILPKSLVKAAKAVADFNLMSVNDIYPIMLVVICMSINRKALIQCGSVDLENFFHMSIFCVAKSGRFKSKVYDIVLKGFLKGEQTLVNAYNEDRSLKERAILKIKQEIAKNDRGTDRSGKPSSIQDIFNTLNNANDLDKQLYNLVNERVPGSFVDDITQERAINKAFKAGGIANFVAEEGQGVITSWSDKYNSSKASNDFALRAMTGSMYRYDRKSQEAVSYRPVASSIIFVQPDIYESQFLNNNSIYSSGMAARILALYWAPIDYANTRKTAENIKLNTNDLQEYWAITEKFATFDDRAADFHYETDEAEALQLIKPVTKITVDDNGTQCSIGIFNKLWERYGEGMDLEGKEGFLNKCLMLAYIMAGTLYAYENHRTFLSTKEHIADKSFFNCVSMFLEYLIQKKANENEIKERVTAIVEAKRLLKLFNGARRAEVIGGITFARYENFINYKRSDNPRDIDAGLELLVQCNIVVIIDNKIYLNPKIDAMEG